MNFKYSNISVDEMQKYLDNCVKSISTALKAQIRPAPDKYREYCRKTHLLPQEFESFENFKYLSDEITSQIKSSVIREVSAVHLEFLNSPVPALTDSKVGGVFYQDDSSLEGVTNLLPVIQINFSQIPKTKELPTSGIFQVYFDNDEYDFITQWHPIVKVNSKYRYPIDIDHARKNSKMFANEYLFVNGYPDKGLKIRPKLAKESNMYDCLTDISSDYAFNSKEYHIAAYLTGMLTLDRPNGNKLLGYDTPVQDCPRSYTGSTRLLLQLDSDSKFLNIYDNGSCQVYISESNLKHKNLYDIDVYSSGY